MIRKLNAAWLLNWAKTVVYICIIVKRYLNFFILIGSKLISFFLRFLFCFKMALLAIFLDKMAFFINSVTTLVDKKMSDKKKRIKLSVEKFFCAEVIQIFNIRPTINFSRQKNSPTFFYPIRYSVKRRL